MVGRGHDDAGGNAAIEHPIVKHGLRHGDLHICLMVLMYGVHQMRSQIERLSDCFDLRDRMLPLVVGVEVLRDTFQILACSRQAARIHRCAHTNTRGVRKSYQQCRTLGSPNAARRMLQLRTLTDS